MKRLIGIILMLTVALAFAGCGGSNEKEVTSASVEMVTTTTEAAPETTEEVTEEETVEETVTQEPETEDATEAAEETTTAAKLDGPLLSYEVRQDGKSTETIHYLYDEQGRKTSAEIVADKTTAEILYTYDENGNLTDECNTSKNGGYIVYAYDKDGRLAKEEHYSVGKNQKPDKLKETRTYAYGKDEHPESLTVLTADGKETVITYEYDARGDVSKSVAKGNTISGDTEISTYSRGDKGELFSILIRAEESDVEWIDLKNEIDYSGRVAKTYTYEHPTAKEVEDFQGAYESKGLENWSTMTEFFYNTDMP